MSSKEGSVYGEHASEVSAGISALVMQHEQH